MTEVQALLLAALQELGRTYGHALSKKLEEMRGRKMSIGSLYKALHKLERDGFARATWEDQNESEFGRPRRRFYEITAVGESALRDYALQMRKSYEALKPWAEGTSP